MMRQSKKSRCISCINFYPVPEKSTLLKAMTEASDMDPKERKRQWAALNRRLQDPTGLTMGVSSVHQPNPKP